MNQRPFSTNVIIRKSIDISVSLFDELVEASLIVDKSQAIMEFLSFPRPLHVILRPRRSGKTTTLTLFRLVCMFKTFFCS